ncbi:MAG: hypothetical protein JW966_04890 [Anaerolineae bacterium]|nr:hypothetical protein [Anaerolineae bacterium]
MDTLVNSTTVSAVNDAAIAGSLGVIAVVTLIVLLVQREMAAAAGGRPAVVFRRVLHVGVVPLLIVFILIAAVKVSELL